MATLFRKILIRVGKTIPFVLAFIIAIGYGELICSIIYNQTIVSADGDVLYYMPINNYIASIIYIDYFDVLLLYILAIALELCKYNFRCVHYLTLNLAVRTLLERVSLDESTIIPICGVMAAMGLICACGGLN